MRLVALNFVLLLVAGCTQTSSGPAPRTTANGSIAQPGELARSTGNQALIETKVQSGGDLDALVDALMRNDSSRAKELIAQGTNVNARDKNGWTPLMFAAAYSRPAPEMLELILAKGADINAKDEAGDTTLIIAIARHNTGLMDMLNLLLARGTDVNATNKQGRTALMVSASARKIEATRALLSKGADVNAKDGDGNTALMLAVEGAANLPSDAPSDVVDGIDKSVTAIIGDLLDKGADAKVTNKKGESALTMANSWADHFGKRGIANRLRAKP